MKQEECNCTCHEGVGHHPMACCFKCPYCGKNIKIYLYQEHIKLCIKKMRIKK